MSDLYVRWCIRLTLAKLKIYKGCLFIWIIWNDRKVDPLTTWSATGAPYKQQSQQIGFRNCQMDLYGTMVHMINSCQIKNLLRVQLVNLTTLKDLQRVLVHLERS